MNILKFLSHFNGVKVLGNGQYLTLCPSHDDNNASLSIKQCENGNIILHCHAGCNYEDVITKAGLTIQDLFEEDFKSNKSEPNVWKRICEYIYTATLKKIRWLTDSGKTFTWEHKKNSADKFWQKGTGGQEIPLYNQSVLTMAKPEDTVFITEGEKDVDTLTALGKIAVCSPHGATKGNLDSKWLQVYTDTLAGRNIVIVPDNDEVGKDYAQAVARKLHGITKSVKVLDLTSKWNDLKDGGDITDVVEMVGNGAMVINDLNELVAMTPKFCPAHIPVQIEKPNDGYTILKKTELVTARDLQKAKLPPKRFFIQGLLAFGISILCAASKIGKSWLVLLWGLAIAAGDMLWDKQVEQVGVLYLALEDEYDRLQDRMDKLLNRGLAPAQFYYLLEVPTLDNGLLSVFDDYLLQHPDIKLIIIDTFQNIRGKVASGLSMYQNDYREMNVIKKYAAEKNVSILIVHHNRKNEDKSDVFNMVSGSNGIMGVADTTFVITKKTRYAKDATLNIIGRDIEQDNLLIQFNKITYKWELTGNADQLEEQRVKNEYDNSPVVKTIKNLLNEAPDRRWGGTATRLLEAGKQVTGSFIAQTAQKLGYELIKLDKLLYEYDKIIYEPTRNGNAGQTHNFRYDESVDSDEAKDADDGNGSNDLNGRNENCEEHVLPEDVEIVDDVPEIVEVPDEEDVLKRIAEVNFRESEMINIALGLD